MGYTLIEKIIKKNIGADHVEPGQIVTVNVDRVMIHDIFIPFVAEKFEEMGFQKLWAPDKVVLIYDHLVPTSAVEDVRHFKIGDAFADKYGLTHVHRSDGICHQLMTEMGYAKPGDIVFGTDSHTTTYGCVGCFSSGIGYTEMAAILGTGEMWIRVPETIKVVIDGTLPANVIGQGRDLTADRRPACRRRHLQSAGDHRLHGGCHERGFPHDHLQHGHRGRRESLPLPPGRKDLRVFRRIHGRCGLALRRRRRQLLPGHDLPRRRSGSGLRLPVPGG